MRKPEQPNQSTGPRSPAGKQRSSRNAVTHGLCSNILILPDESEEEFNQLKEGWMDDYDPPTNTARGLVSKAAIAEWYLLRAIRRHNQAEQAIYAEAPDPMQWTEEHHKTIERFTRYRTAQERAFARAFSNLERLRKNRKQEANASQRTEERMAALELKALKQQEELRMKQAKLDAQTANQTVKAEQKAEKEKAKPQPPPKKEPTRGELLFQGQHHPKKMRKIAVLDQWVEVEIENGKTVTTLFPSNEKLIAAGKKMLPPPELIYRRINFRDGVPPEYQWTGTNAQRNESGAHGIQRMTVDTWLDVIDREKLREDGHIGPTGVGNLPRPIERGGCNCPTCTKNRSILEKRAQQGA